MNSQEKIELLMAQIDISQTLHRQEFEKVRRYEEMIKKLKRAIHAQHSTMNHMENTEREHGQVNGLLQASTIVDKVLKE